MGATPLHDTTLVDAPAQIPPGEYSAAYLGHKTVYFARQPKVIVFFRIGAGEYAGTKIERWYRVHALHGKPRKNGRIKLKHSQELFRQFVRCTGGRERPDRLSLQRLSGCMLRVSVRTVTTDSKQRKLPEALQYSVVDEMLAIEAGSV